MTTFRKILLATVAAFAVTVTYGRTITPYEYLTISGAGQNGFHVLTDIVPKSNTVVRAKYSSSSNAKTGHNQLLFCSRTDYNTSDLFQFAPNVGGKFSFGYYNKTFPSDDTFEPGNVYEVCVRDGVAQIKDAATEDVVAELGTGTEDFSPRYRLALFQSYSYNNGYVSWSNSFHGNFYYLKIYDIEGGEEVLKHHFIACLEDGVVKVCDLADSYRTYALTKNGSGTSSVNIGGSADAPVSFVAWTGNDSANPTDWFSPDNWDGYAVPGVGDNVSVGTGASVIISNSTPALASISVSGTLMFTNWATCLSATTVTIPSGGILTCAGPFTDTAMSNRVWIACTDLTIATGGSIDVSDKGFASAKGPGKGFSSNQVAGGGAHGGYGSTLNHATAVKSSFANAAYDSASEPILPGSGGNSHPGGGAIRIDALGVVTLNGDLLANGQNAGNSDSRTGGAGGSILVNCSRIIAAPGARIYAEGGNLAGANYPVKNVRLAGAGGRIAIHYDPSAQTAADMAGAFVSAAAGYDMYVYNTSTRRYPASRYSLAWCNAAQDGTLWLQDEKAFGTGLAYLGTHFAGRLVNVSSLSVDGDLAVTNRLGFANAGVALTVSGNLSVVGHFGKFVFGETELSTTRARKRSAGSLPVSLVVGGDFSLSDGGRADIHAGATNGTDVAGAVISVGGAFTVGDDSTVYLYSHPENGGAPFITAASCSIDEGALVSADTFGFESANDVKN